MFGIQRCSAFFLLFPDLRGSQLIHSGDDLLQYEDYIPRQVLICMLFMLFVIHGHFTILVLTVTVDTPRVNFTFFSISRPMYIVCTDLLPMGSCLSSMKLYPSMTRDNYVLYTTCTLHTLNEGMFENCGLFCRVSGVIVSQYISASVLPFFFLFRKDFIELRSIEQYKPTRFESTWLSLIIYTETLYIVHLGEGEIDVY